MFLQLLLATKTPADRKEKMWSQIESEMCLQRSKTIAQMCKTKQVARQSQAHCAKLLSGQEVKSRMREESSRPVPTSPPLSLEADQETEVDRLSNTDKSSAINLVLRQPAVGSRR